MLRIRFLSTALPLVLVGVMAGGGLAPTPRPCILAGGIALQMAFAPWQNPVSVSFTDDPAAATVRVQIVDSPELADFAVSDDTPEADEADSCTEAAPRFVAITGKPAAAVIYLGREDGADYRVFVQSRSFDARAAAALIVGARGSRSQHAAAL